MFKAIKSSTVALLIAAVSAGSMMSVTTASASEVYDIVVVPAEDDRAALEAALTKGVRNGISATSFSTIETTQTAARIASTPRRAAMRPAETSFAWPYTARTIDQN